MFQGEASGERRGDAVGGADGDGEEKQEKNDVTHCGGHYGGPARASCCGDGGGLRRTSFQEVTRVTKFGLAGRNTSREDGSHPAFRLEKKD